MKFIIFFNILYLRSAEYNKSTNKRCEDILKANLSKRNIENEKVSKEDEINNKSIENLVNKFMKEFENKQKEECNKFNQTINNHFNEISKLKSQLHIKLYEIKYDIESMKLNLKKEIELNAYKYLSDMLLKSDFKIGSYLKKKSNELEILNNKVRLIENQLNIPQHTKNALKKEFFSDLLNLSNENLISRDQKCSKENN